MDRILNIYKPVGITPVQLIEQLRRLKPEYQDVNIGFAGRLDPLAHGVMLLMVGEENKNRLKYLNLNKGYKFSVLFGVETDSYDYLGLLKSLSILDAPESLDKKIKGFIKSNTGIFSQTYPPFSSKTINGIQMYKLAKLGKLPKDNLPERQVEIFSFKLLSTEMVPAEKVKQAILENLKKIRGNFRQTKIVMKWREFFKLNSNYRFTLAHFEIECSSGTYVRSLANKMGEQFECGGIAFEIFRTKVGVFKVKPPNL